MSVSLDSINVTRMLIAAILKVVLTARVKNLTLVMARNVKVNIALLFNIRNH